MRTSASEFTEVGPVSSSELLLHPVRLRRLVVEFTDRPQQDDMAILVLRIGG